MLTPTALFLSRPGEWWDGRIIISAVLAGLATLAVGVFTAGSIFAHKREAETAEASLHKYKLSVEEKVAQAKASGLEAGRKAGEASGIAEKAKADVAVAQADAARSNAKAAEANARAQAAALALAEFAAPRHLNDQKKSRIKKSLMSFSGTPFVISIQTSGEALDFERQLVDVLSDAGWLQQGTPNTMQYTLPGQPPLGIVSLTGITIHVDEGRADLFSATKAAQIALEAEGFPVDAKCIVDGSEDVKDAVHILIGEKPRS